ncbi:MAG: ABC transporter permease [Lautropia sp.]|nr:ABC transporter permease [Lautropia sp.]
MSALLRGRLLRDLGIQACLGLADHRLRTVLSILGIAIGIAAVILIGVVSKGGQQLVFSELETFGLRTTWVFRDRRSTDPHTVQREGSGIDNADLAAIRQSNCCPGLQSISPVVVVRSDALSWARAGRRYEGVQLTGVGLAYLQVNNDALAMGRGFTEQEMARGSDRAIIGEKVRSRLFADGRTPIGAEIHVGSLRLTVIGVLQAKDRSFLESIGSAGGQDANNRVLVPYRRVQALAGNTQINVLQSTLAPGADVHAAEQLTGFLWRRHKGAFDYRWDGMTTYVHTAQRILGGVSTVGVVAAAVSLIVAGLGILNIMSTSVLERTREIGLRKAVGGSASAIMVQFLIEACLISLSGGALGLLLGAVASVLITALTGLQLLPSASVIMIALGVSLLVGVAAGILPAWRAARLLPVEALRYE